MKILYNDARGKDLNTLLNDPKFVKKLENTRAFYIIKPKSEDILKFGISGNNDGGGIGRLQQYRLTYGISDSTNDCLGVKLMFLGVTKYNSDVEAKNSEVHKREQHVIKYIKENNLIARGRERTVANYRNLVEIVKSYKTKDEPTKIRKSQRETKGQTGKYKD